MVSPRLAAAVLLASLLAAGAADQPPSYDQALQAYWREDNVAAARMMCAIVTGSTNATDVQRAGYLFATLVENKMKTNELAALRDGLAAASSPFEGYVAGSEALRRGDKPGAFSRLAGFAVNAPNDALRLLGLRALCRDRWERTEIGGNRFLLLGLLETAQRLDFQECPESFLAMTQTLDELATGERDPALEAKVTRFLFDSRPTQRGAFRTLRALLRSGQTEEAGAFVEEALGKLPASFDTYSQLAQACSESGASGKAIEILERGTKELGPGHCQMALRLASEYERQRQWTNAVRTLQGSAALCGSLASNRLNELRGRAPDLFQPAPSP